MCIRDRIYFAFIIYPVFYFLLATYNTASYYITLGFAVMLPLGFAVLVALKSWHSPLTDEPVAFDRNLTAYGLGLSFALGAFPALILILANKMGSFQVFQTCLYIPKSGVVLGAMPGLGDALYQFSLVAPAEETFKVVGIYAPYSRFQDERIAVLPIAIWALLHTVLAGFTVPMVFFALFIGGLWYWLLRETGSLVSCILAHGVYNSLIILAQNLP